MKFKKKIELLSRKVYVGLFNGNYSNSGKSQVIAISVISRGHVITKNIAKASYILTSLKLSFMGVFYLKNNGFFFLSYLKHLYPKKQINPKKLYTAKHLVSF